MNPNLRIFLKRSVYVLVFAAVIAGIFFSLPKFFDTSLMDIGNYLLYGFGAFMIVVMSVLFIGLIVRVAWTGIMNRTDTIAKCCPDNTQEGIHLVCSHYNPGGESTEGFSTFFHYYIDRKGKLYLSKKVEDDGQDLTKSIRHLSEQTRLELDPDLQSSVRIGAHDDADNTGKDVVIRINKGELRLRGYEGLIDYGFKLSFYVRNKKQWSLTI